MRYICVVRDRVNSQKFTWTVRARVRVRGEDAWVWLGVIRGEDAWVGLGARTPGCG